MIGKNNQSFGLLLEISSFEGLKVFPFNGKEKLSTYSTLIPNQIRHIIRKSFLYGSIEADLLRYLRDRELSFPFYIKIGSYLTMITWDPISIYKRKTILKLSENLITVSRVGIISDTLEQNLFLLGEELVVNIRDKKLVRIKSSSGWDIWHFFYNLQSKSIKEDILKKRKLKKPKDYFTSTEPVNLENDDINLSSEKFNELSIYWAKKIRDDLIFYNENQEKAKLAKSKIQNVTSSEYKITVYRDDYTGNMVLQPKFYIKEESFFPNRDLYDFFYERINSNIISQSNIINLFTPEQKDRYLILKNNWSRIAMDLEKEIKLYWIAIKYFKEDLFCQKEKPFQMFVNSNLFYQSIASFQKELVKNDIELTYEEKSLEIVNLDFNLEVKTNKSGYELNSLITKDGEALDLELLQTINNGETILFQENKVSILDEKTRQIIKELLNLFPEKKKTRIVSKSSLSIPRLQILDWLFMKSLGLEIKIDPEITNVFDKLIDFQEIKPFLLVKNFKGKLRPYQKQGYDWLGFLYDHYFGACLADDMGLGKTIQIIAFLGALKEKIFSRSKKTTKKYHLIVVPPGLVYNWFKELKRFYPDFKVFEYVGASRRRNFDNYHIIITTYDILRREIDKFKQKDFHVIVFDEAQICKNFLAKRTIAAKQLNAEFKICLTGTPLENHIGEYFSIINIALPGLLGDLKLNKNNDQFEDNINKIVKRTKPFVLRRTKKEILKELPPKSEENIYLSFSDKQKEIYHYFLKEVKTTIDNAYKEKKVAQAQIIALTSILRLRQICLSPYLVDKRFKGDYPKINYLVKKLIELKEEGHSALVFSQFKSFLDLIAKQLKIEGMDFFQIDGSTPMVKRARSIADFQDSEEASIFLMTLKTGGMGLNLTKASYIFHMDPWWNPSVEEQASDRAHRIGQTRKVFVQRILMHNSIEEKIVLLKKQKIKLFDKIFNQGLSKVKGHLLTKSDFDFLTNISLKRK